MENLYNVKITFKGEGSFTFVLPKYGELTVYPYKDIFVKGLSVTGVEALRELRPLLLEHQLNAKPDGCFRVIDLSRETNMPIQKFERAIDKMEKIETVADLKASLVKGPIVEDEIDFEGEITGTVDEIVEEEANPADYILTSTKHKGKKISDLTKQQISSNLSKFNKADLAMIEEYKKSL